mmetsp:Transcript_42017/g.101004  ORF Transcript_42017/g.101004 Transcript_42017/m.101004 type:complete len:1345 (+) Transcript_42017:1423-5457(+)
MYYRVVSFRWIRCSRSRSRSPPGHHSSGSSGSEGSSSLSSLSEVDEEEEEKEELAEEEEDSSPFNFVGRDEHEQEHEQQQQEEEEDGDRTTTGSSDKKDDEEENNKKNDDEAKDKDTELPSDKDAAATSSTTEDLTSSSPSPDTTLTTATAVTDTTVTTEAAATTSEKRKLTEEELIDVANKVFGEAELETFTMKHIFNALVEKQGGMKLTKQQKDTVRTHIQDILTKQAAAEAEETGKDDGKDKEEEEGVDQGSDDDSSEAASEQGDEMSEYEDDDDDDDDDFDGKSRRRGRKTKATPKDKSSKTKNKSGKKKRSSSSMDSLASSSKKRPSMRKAAKAARMLEQQRLRKKRMEDLRVRNEEMLLNQSKEDQERQDAIAAKFETNTDELRMKRLEDRLDLLQRLDEKRISVVALSTDSIVGKKEEINDVGTMPTDQQKADTDVGKTQEDQQKIFTSHDHKEDVPSAVNTEESESSDDESSDEEDLVIIGMNKPFKPLKKLHNHLPSRGISILEQIQSPKSKKNGVVGTVAPVGTSPSSRSAAVTAPPASGPTGKKTDGLMMSPNRSMGARFALRNALKKKQRMAGNQWLARELGYKSEQEHLKDCQTAAAQKRELVIRLEQERLKANERKNLRERILLEEAKAFGVDTIEDADEDGDDQNADSQNPVDENGNLHSNQDEEEDEEMQMAKQIEQEANDQALQDGSTSKDDDSSSHVDGEADEAVAGSSTQVDAEMQINESNSSEIAEEAPSNLSQEGSESHTINDVQSQETQPLDEESKSLVKHNSTNTDVEADTHSDSPESVTQELFVTQPLFETESSTLATIAEEKAEGQSNRNLFDQHVSLPAEAPVGHDTQDQADQPGKESRDEQAAEEEGTEDIEVQSDSPSSNGGNKESNSEGTAEDSSEGEDKVSKADKGPRNAGWQAMLQREAEKLKKLKRRKGDLVEEEAEEEEEEEVAGLEDFGFTVSKKKKEDDDDDSPDADRLDEDDLEHVVDDLSDDEGDEDAGREARKLQEQREEKERHKEMIRRLKEGYDGRRGGIAGGGAGARGMHRFDQLVAADNREDAKRLGLLNDDELDSDDEGAGGKGNSGDDEEDEAALVDKMIKDRHLHRTDVDFEENFSDDEEESDEQEGGENGTIDEEDEEERSQDILARRFAKRARMQRLEEIYGESQEFSQRRLIDEDESMKEELSQMRNGLVRHRSISSTISRTSQSSDSNMGPVTKKRRGSDSDSSTNEARKASSLAPGSFFRRNGGSLSIALQASRKNKRRSIFLGGPSAEGKEGSAISATFGHKTFAMFSSQSSRSSFGPSNSLPGVSNKPSNKKICANGSTSLFSRVSAGNGKA